MVDFSVELWVLLVISGVMMLWTAFWGLFPPVLSIAFALWMQKKGIEAYITRADKKGKELEKKLKKGLLDLVTKEIWKKENLKPLRKAMVTSIRGWYANVMRAEQDAMQEIIQNGGSLTPGQKFKAMINDKIGPKYGVTVEDIQSILSPDKSSKGPGPETTYDEY